MSIVALAAVYARAQQTQAPAPIVQEPPVSGTVFKVTTRLVNVFVNAVDATGFPVGDLNKDDFEVLEDKKPQTISVFEKQAETPLSIVMAVDTSNSVMSASRFVHDAGKQFVASVVRQQDELEVLAFDQNVDEVVPFTNDAKKIESGLQSLRPGEATALYNAVYLAGQTLQGRHGKESAARKRVIVLITDGDDTVHGQNYEQAMEQAQRAEAMIFPIIVVPVAADAGRNTGGEHALIQMAEDTGGKYYYADSPVELKKALAHVSDDLRTQYLLGYYAPQHRPGTKFHAITVQLKDAKLRAADTLRFRTGYYSDNK